SAGVGALVSALPNMHPYILPIGLGILALITIINLRGVKESGMAFAIPTYLFIATLGAVLAIGVYRALTSGGQPVPLEVPPALPQATAVMSLWLFMRSFASGCTAMTGVEAVSNGVQVFAEPTVKNAQRTLTAIVAILAVFLAGIGYLCNAYHIGAMDATGQGYQSVISQLTAAIVGKGIFYYLVIGCTLAVLALSANTGFADFPRLCRLVAEDDFLPHAFANRGRRLVYSLGIIIIAVLAAALLIAFGGITDHLIPLFAVGAFLAFTLSQSGMVVHWLKLRTEKWRLFAFVNGIGAVATSLALIVVLVAKFTEGAWITCLIIPLFVGTFIKVKRHYIHVARETRKNDPIDLSKMQPPIVIVPIKSWTSITEKAMQLALSISPDVVAMHISTVGGESDDLREKWERVIGKPILERGLAKPQLVLVSSPYRRLFSPLIEFVHDTCEQNPDRLVAVVIPELVESKWYQYFLHNQRATGLKAALLLRGGNRVVVINVPWYLGDPPS
ncbi:MAG: APC family permease, partial [Chlorobia bacterium]|nr:APC family permease [Fimbriimonadaceae bacterium]